MNTENFASRHLGINPAEQQEMLDSMGISSLKELIEQTIPAAIRPDKLPDLPEPMTEREYAEHIRELASKNQIFTSYIGMGWYDTVTPAPIRRHIFENPVWYTSYTPYQAEISQGRLEALLNFQTLVSDLTALPLANCSLLDEATAAAEAAVMMFNHRSKEQVKAGRNVLFVDEHIFESTLAVLKTVMDPLEIELMCGDYRSCGLTEGVFGIIIQYPNADGNIEDYREITTQANSRGIQVAVGADILSLCLLIPPGEWGADICFGSTQRMGIPMFYGGPAAAYFAARESYKREMPGRIIGISKDAHGKKALRMALQTREQHIKREKATSNICTAQALMANMAAFYAIYHGPSGLKNIATRIHSLAGFLAGELITMGCYQENPDFFDTLKIRLPEQVSVDSLHALAIECKVNFRYYGTGEIGISLDETTQPEDIGIILYVFSSALGVDYFLDKDIPEKIYFEDKFYRRSAYLEHPVFNSYHTETELMRYIYRLAKKDISLAHSMIPLGSCTMKLNAVSELLPVSDPGFANIHPYAPEEQTEGYQELIENLSGYLAELTGLPGVSFQPNSGAAGEYAGLMVIRKYHESKGETHRNCIFIPASSHGTNPASAVRAGYEPVVIACDEGGNTDLNDLKAKIPVYRDRLAGLMITYPSTHGIFEEEIVEICRIIHENGGQVYMDGANMNAQVCLTNPGYMGADVCHLNLHKTFAMPHGGGGPGAGPICVAKHLCAFLPGHPETGTELNTVSSSPFGSAGLFPVTYGYIRLMGTEGLCKATEIAILNANYLASRLEKSYGILYTGSKGRVGHELILECRTIKNKSGITETDIAKRLIDFGFHAPTVSFPVAGTLMIEPTESESLSELKRFTDALLTIRKEIDEIVEGKANSEDNVLKNAPHPEYEACTDVWSHSYSREKAVYPLDWVKENKFWVNVARIDSAFGDRNLIPIQI